MAETIYLTEGELAWLIEQSRGPGRVVQTTLGTATLPDTPGNQWAIEALMKRRHEQEIPTTAHAMAAQEEGA